MLIECKIRGALDEGQLAAHKKKLANCKEIIRIEWNGVIDVLDKIKYVANDLQQFLIEEFTEVSLSFNKRRAASGMLKEIIAGRNKSQEIHFGITGSKEMGTYTIGMNYPGRKQCLKNGLLGIQDARRWIANYVHENATELFLEAVD